MDLNSCRSGMGDGPILWTAVREYARVYEFDEEQTEDLHYYITHMDEAFREWKQAKNA